MKVAAVQLRVTDDRGDNIARTRALIDDAAAQGVSVVLLPELFSVPFVQPEPDLDFFKWGEPIDGPSNTMALEASAAHGITVVSSIFEQTARPGVYHNTSCTYVNGVEVQQYRKSHLPFSNGFPEKFYFRPGEEKPAAVDIGETRLGTIICYERHFPELGRQVALSGASIMCVPVACSSAPMREVFQLELRTQAIANGFFVICANRIGTEVVKDYFGTSAIYGPDGEIIAQSSDTGGDELIIADIDLDRVAATREKRPFLRDLRPELYV
ncbi:MAG: carbon-nitrogen hydrolase family protein [Actinobacteria bacterium]|nr:carbon-nitrogen hydrolase family protein [Actinomycetota bacterium]